MCDLYTDLGFSIEHAPPPQPPSPHLPCVYTHTWLRVTHFPNCPDEGAKQSILIGAMYVLAAMGSVGYSEYMLLESIA